MDNHVNDILTNKKRMNYKSLLIENIKYRTLLTEKYKQRKPFEKKNEKIMTAYIPGSVREIFVKPNKKVQIGDKLLVLEAMKMKNEILAPISGVIKSIHVSVGDKLRKDDLILEFK